MISIYFQIYITNMIKVGFRLDRIDSHNTGLKPLAIPLVVVLITS